MALSLVKGEGPRNDFSVGPKRVRKVAYTADNSYPTGGYAMTLQQLGLSALEEAIALNGMNAQGYVIRVDVPNKKLMFFYGDYNNAADGPLIEVPNATSLTGVTGHFYAIGY